MPLDRPALKRKAIDTIRASKPNVIYVALAYVALTALVGILSAKLMGVSYSMDDIARLAQYYTDGNYDAAYKFLERANPPFSSHAINTLLNMVMGIVSAGFIIFLLNIIRNAGACIGNLLDGFGFFLRIIILNVLEAVFIFLWSLLLIVPGIIATYRYSQAIYILIDHPELSPLDCIRESSRMMSGHKGELFVLDLSFIGWLILASLPVVGYLVSLWTTPYIGMTHALYYIRLAAGETEPLPPAEP